jgi:hypothetical protein
MFDSGYLMDFDMQQCPNYKYRKVAAHLYQRRRRFDHGVWPIAIIHPLTKLDPF